jgi:CheY-like chemotaxis protein
MLAPTVTTRQKILIVDDEPGMVHALARTLLDMAQLHFAVRGDDALQKLAQHKPDLMLIDAELPDISGMEVIRRLRADPALMHTKVVMVTSHDTDHHRQQAFELGALDFFTKPIDRDAIRWQVQRLLDGDDVEVISLGGAAPAPQAAAPVTATAAATRPVVAVATSAPQPPIDMHRVTSELFERFSAILSQAELLRERAAPGADALPVQRIQEECAEAIQLLVTLSGED